MNAERQFTSYAHKDLDRKKIIKLARQYDGVDMTQMFGANDSHFPFLVRSHADSYELLFWNRTFGMMAVLDEDPVRSYATILFMLDRAYPVFNSLSEAEQWAIDHNWPRDPLSSDSKQAEQGDPPKSLDDRDIE